MVLVYLIFINFIFNLAISPVGGGEVTLYTSIHIGLANSFLFKEAVAYSGGGYGAKPPPGPVKSFDFRGFSGPNGC